MNKEKDVKQRRKAIDCKLIEPSKTSPGYFKYVITIRELDGSIHTVPAYGVDMQDAIRRLLKTERDAKINKVYIRKIEPITLIAIFTCWVVSVISSLVLDNYQYAYWGVISLFTVVFSVAVFRFIRGIQDN